jgi:predicted metal-dependent hydrolase
MHFDSPVTSKIPIPKLILESQNPFITNADTMLTKHKDLQEESDEFLDWLQDEYDVEKLSNKLKSFYELDEDEFIKEVKRKSSKKRISPAQRKELIKYFHEYKDKINPILQTIDETDNAIDQMVYELYGLTEEEIRIVEES